MKVPTRETLEEIAFIVVAVPLTALFVFLIVVTAQRVLKLEDRVDALEARCAK